MIFFLADAPRTIENVDRNDETLFWVSISLAVYSQITPDVAGSLGVVKSETIGEDVLIGLDMSKLQTIITAIHQNKWIHQEGGFVVHRNKDAGEKYLQHLLEGNQSQFNAPNIDNKDVAANLMQSVQSTGMFTFGKKLLKKFKTRYAFSEKGVKASEWIKKQIEKLCASRSDIVVESVANTVSEQKSIVVTIQGSDQGNNIVILGAHLDSISDKDGKMSESKPAPGADDDASGVIVLMEALRVIIQTEYKPKNTVQIMVYGAEEIGLVGSEQIASEYSNDGKNVVGMLQFDMVGHKEGTAFNFALSKDFSNLEHSRFVGTLVDEYLGLTYVFSTCGYGCSDHASWYAHDFPATYAGEGRAFPNPFYHTEGDTFETLDVDYMGNYAKLAVIYLAELAKGTVA